MILYKYEFYCGLLVAFPPSSDRDFNSNTKEEPEATEFKITSAQLL